MFVTAEGSPSARFRRALATGSSNLVLDAAAELPRVSLEDALAVCMVLARERDPRYPRAAGRWLGRLLLERGLTLEQGLRAVAALVELGSAPQEAWARAALATLTQGDRAGPPLPPFPR
jgi:hypothetical protein